MSMSSRVSVVAFFEHSNASESTTNLSSKERTFVHIFVTDRQCFLLALWTNHLQQLFTARLHPLHGFGAKNACEIATIQN